MEEKEDKPKVETYNPEPRLPELEKKPEVSTYTPEPKPATKTTNGGHIQVYNIVEGKDPSWQGIIYDLISSEQLDPWNVDIGLLCQRYFEKIKNMEESNFLVSSKMLLAASLLLRIKSEILLNTYIQDIDEILFGKKEDKKYVLERIEIDENEIPILSPKTPLPRFKKVTLQELMSALDTAIKTESRRIDRVIEKKQAERLSYVDIPKFRRVNIKDRIRHFYAKVLAAFNSNKHKDSIKIPYTHFTGNDKEQRIACFLPMLHLSNNKKVWLEQEGHYEEIWIYLFKKFHKAFPEHDKELIELEQELQEEVEGLKEELDDEQQKRVEKINKDFENPVGDLIQTQNEEI